MRERTFDDFDEFADDYRAIHTKNIQLSGADSYYFAEMKVRLLEGYEQETFLKILDIGCGDGLSALFMEQHYPNWHIKGIDISEKSIQVATERKLTNAVFTVYDGSNIPFEDMEFDMVFMAGVLHHVSFCLHQNLLLEIYRVLKKNGKLSLYEHNPLNPLTKYMVKTCVFDKDAQLLRYGYTKKLLSSNGFNLQRRKFIIFFPRKGLFSNFIFLEKYLQWIPFGGQYFIQAIKD